MNVVTYARVSTQGQAEHGYSLNEQKMLLAAHCERLGYTLLEHVADEGVSGRLADRPGLRRVLALSEAGRIGAVVAVNLKRLGRENRLIQEALHQVRRHGVKVEFTEHGSGETAADRLLENVLGGVAEFEWEEIRLRTMKGKLQKAQEKKVMANGRAPFGFHCISRAEAEVVPEFRGRDGEYLVIQEEAALVRQIFEHYAGGKSLRSLAEWINAQPGTEGRRFCTAGLRWILKNPAYYGEPEYRRHEHRIGTNESTGKPIRQYVLRDEKERVKLSCPAIISRELFEAAQERLVSNKQQLSGRPSNRWPLTGCLRCAVCKNANGTSKACRGFGGTSHRLRRYYVCASRWDKVEYYCRSQYDAEELEEMASLALDRAAEPGRLAALARAQAEAEQKRAGDPAAIIKRCRVELVKLDGEEERVLEAALSGFAQHIIQKKLETLKTRRAELDREMAEAEDQVMRLRDPEEAARLADRAAERLRVGLTAAKQDPQKLAELYRLFLAITLEKDAEPLIETRVPITL